MRIVAGDFRGRKLHTPKGEKIRPTTDRVREAIFNIIASRVPEATVLDLYAGTGALGLEAISRGAATALFVDQHAVSVRLIRSNIQLCGVEDRARVIHGAVHQIIQRLAKGGKSFELIFMDPPYGRGLVEKTLPWLTQVAEASTLVVAEHHIKDILPSNCGPWLKAQERFYGDTVVTFYSHSAASVDCETS